ncbi:MAG: DUF1501 domain-containing protein, partial [Planctomycetales bacterium]|nr:DUF1501 domain-containing protein [Planctomycetales bacterium]
MLSIYDGRPVSRRKLLTVGGLGLGGLTLPSLLAARGSAADEPRPLTGKSVIFLFQQGGPSQFETFDPKPDAPEAIRTATGVVGTALPSVVFGDALQQLAARADKLTVVRSFQTQNAGHNIEPIVGKASRNTSIGAHYARIAGATRPASGMPTTAILYPAAVDEDVPGPSARGDLTSTGDYPRSLAPFVPGAGGDLQKDMKVSLPHERFFGDRRSVLQQLDRLKRTADAKGQLEAMDQAQAQAYQVLLGGGVSRALDLSAEDPRVVERYDTRKYSKKRQWDKVARGRSGYYNAQASTIGKLLL